jgi:hypothetical protein
MDAANFLQQDSVVNDQLIHRIARADSSFMSSVGSSSSYFVIRQKLEHMWKNGKCTARTVDRLIEASQESGFFGRLSKLKSGGITLLKCAQAVLCQTFTGR